MISRKNQQKLVLRALLKAKEIEDGNVFVADYGAVSIIKELVIEIKACQQEIDKLEETNKG